MKVIGKTPFNRSILDSLSNNYTGCFRVSKKFKNVYRYVGGMTEWYLSNNKSIGDCNIYEYVKCKTHDCYPPYPPMDI